MKCFSTCLMCLQLSVAHIANSVADFSDSTVFGQKIVGALRSTSLVYTRVSRASGSSITMLVQESGEASAYLSSAYLTDSFADF